MKSSSLKNNDNISEAEHRLDLGDVLSAAKICQDILKSNPRSGAGWALWGRIVEKNGDQAGALKSFLRAIECDPNVSILYLNAGQIALRLSNFELAKSLFSKLVALDPRSSEGFHGLGRAYSYMGKYVEAEPHFRRSIELDAYNPDVYEHLATGLEKMNHTEQAMELLQQGISVCKESVDFMLPLAKLQKRSGDLQASEASLDKLINYYAGKRQISIPQTLKLSVALGDKAQLLEKRKEFDKAFELFVEGQKLLARFHAASKAAILSDKENNPNAAIETEDGENYFDSLVARSRDWFNKETVSKWPDKLNGGAQSPLFLVGFPRSGTTLMGNVLAAHKNMLTMQEKSIVDGIVIDFGRGYPDVLENLTESEIRTIQKKYLERANRELGPTVSDKCTIVDKMPFNNIHLGAIYRIFPEVKVLSMIRDPRDACLSCFVQNFNYNPATVQMDTLEGTVDLYRRVMELYLQYRDILPEGTILEVKYEDLVNDLENVSRKILDFAGEEWDANVLEYYKAENNRYVATPSYEGVMKPVYKTAAGKWKNYERHFSPYLQKLDPFIKEFGYEL